MVCSACQSPNDPDAESCFNCGRPLAPPIKRGTVIASRYEVLSTLGKGGMGTVYLARDRVLGERVAVKVLKAELSRRPDMVRRFQTEMKAAQRVRHPNLCRIYGAGEEAGRLYVCMELVAGTDLRTLIREQKGLPPEQAFQVALDVAGGLQALHDAKLVHRDVKALNVLVDARGRAKLMDFDVAKHAEAEGVRAATATSQVLGTPEYMSPEYARGEPVDFRSDIYSLGVLAFELFTGEVPFRGETPVATILKHLQEPPPLAGPRAERLPAGLVPVLRKALAKRPEERYSTARGLTVALRVAREAWSERVPPPPPGSAGPLPALLEALNPIDKTVRIAPPPRRDPMAGKAIPVLVGALGGPASAQEAPPPPSPPEPAPQGGERPAPVAVLVEALRSEDRHDRARAARVLGGIGPAAEEAIPVLLEALRDREATVRYDAAKALERMGAAAEAALARALHDEDQVVRRIAAEALARIIKRKRGQLS
jgi:serine/threonine-protein kinase